MLSNLSQMTGFDHSAPFATMSVARKGVTMTSEHAFDPPDADRMTLSALGVGVSSIHGRVVSMANEAAEEGFVELVRYQNLSLAGPEAIRFVRTASRLDDQGLKEFLTDAHSLYELGGASHMTRWANKVTALMEEDTQLAEEFLRASTQMLETDFEQEESSSGEHIKRDALQEFLAVWDDLADEQLTAQALADARLDMLEAIQTSQSGSQILAVLNEYADVA